MYTQGSRTTAADVINLNKFYATKSSSFMQCYATDRFATILLPLNIILVSMLRTLKPILMLGVCFHLISSIPALIPSSSSSSSPSLNEEVFSAVLDKGKGRQHENIYDRLSNSDIENSSEVFLDTLVTISTLISKLAINELHMLKSYVSSSHLFQADSSLASFIIMKLKPLLCSHLFTCSSHQQNAASSGHTSFSSSSSSSILDRSVLIKSIVKQLTIVWLLLMQKITFLWNEVLGSLRWDHNMVDKTTIYRLFTMMVKILKKNIFSDVFVFFFHTRFVSCFIIISTLHPLYLLHTSPSTYMHAQVHFFSFFFLKYMWFYIYR
jgi:hypothetical protein